LDRVLAPEGELLSFASPRQLLLRCSTSCIHAVEKKVTKEKATRLPLASCVPRFHLALPEGPSLALWQRAASLQRPYGLFPVKAPVLGAAYGIGFLPAADFFVFSRSHALRGNAVKGALRRELSA